MQYWCINQESTTLTVPRAVGGISTFGASCFIVLGIFFVLRVGLTYLPCESWGPSGFLCAAHDLLSQHDHPVACIAQYAFGEGTRLGNRFDFLNFRSEKFTVDKLGYRNPPFPVTPQVLLVGSSFSLGMSLNDQDTFSAQLNRELGPAVYNASTWIEVTLTSSRIKRVAQTVGMQRGWVLLELINRVSYGYEPSAPLPTPNKLALLRASLIGAVSSLHHPFALVRISSLLNMRLHNDILFPNMYKNLYPEEELETGRRVLYFSEDEKFSQEARSAVETAAAVAHLRDDLNRSGLKLAVVLVPTGYSAYYPLLKRTPGPDYAKQYMADLSSLLTKNQVPVWNGLPVMREAAATQLAAGRLVYWPDDAHWNSLGVATAAQSVAPWLRALTQNPPHALQ